MKQITLPGQPEAPVLRELTRLAESITGRNRLQTGYPFDQETNLDGFYRWLLDTGLCNTTLCQVGSPWKSQWDCLNVDEIERKVVDFAAAAFGFPDDAYWGFVTNGGTDGNLHGIYFGRKELNAKSELPPILYVSEESHYSLRKLGDVLSIDTRVVKAVPDGRMEIADFKRQLDASRPALVAVAVGGTFKGAIDDQAAIREALAEVRPPASYIHLDVALFGGYLPWLGEPEAAKLVNQARMGFDSIAVSGHKFLAANEPTGIFVCRGEILPHLNCAAIPYLNGSVPTVSCTRSGFDVLKLYWRIMTTRPEGFRAEAKHVFAMTAALEAALKKRGVPVYVNPWSTTVVFRRPADEVIHRYCLACQGGWSHVVVMQYFNDDLIERMADDIAGNDGDE